MAATSLSKTDAHFGATSDRRTPAGRSKIRTLVVLLAVAFIAALAVPSWNRLVKWQYVSKASRALYPSDGGLARPEVALEALLYAQRLDPDDAEVQYLLAVSCRRLGRFDYQAQHISRAERLDWPQEDLDRQNMLGVVQAGDVDAVHSKLKDLLVDGVPDSAAEEIYEAMAKGYLTSYRMQEALGSLHHWIEWKKSVGLESVQARLWMGDMLERVDRMDEAVNEYKTILAFDPKCLEARVKLASVYLSQTQGQLAYDEFSRSLTELAEREAKAPSPPDWPDGDPETKEWKAGQMTLAPIRRSNLMLNLANALSMLSRTAESKEMYERVLTLELAKTERSRALVALAQIEAPSEETDEGGAVEEGAVEEGASEAPSGESAADPERLNRAITLLREAAELDPLSNTVHYTLSNLLKEVGQTEEARKELEKHKELTNFIRESKELTGEVFRDPGNPGPRTKLGQLMLSLQMHEEGVAWLETALESKPDYLPALEALVKHYAAMGNRNKASIYAAEVQRLKPAGNFPEPNKGGVPSEKGAGGKSPPNRVSPEESKSSSAPASSKENSSPANELVPAAENAGGDEPTETVDGVVPAEVDAAKAVP